MLPQGVSLSLKVMTGRSWPSPSFPLCQQQRHKTPRRQRHSFPKCWWFVLSCNQLNLALVWDPLYEGH